MRYWGQSSCNLRRAGSMLAGALVVALVAGGASAQSLRLNNAEKVAPVSVAKTEELALNLHAVEDAADHRRLRYTALQRVAVRGARAGIAIPHAVLQRPLDAVRNRP